MKKLHIHGLWLVLQMVSTTLGNINSNTADAALVTTVASTIQKSSSQKTIPMSKSTLTASGEAHTNTRYLQDTSYSRTNVFIPERTPSHSVRNLFKRTRSRAVRNTFKSTQSFYQTGSMYMESITVAGSVEPKRTYVHSSETDQLNPSDVQLSNTTMASIHSTESVQYTRGGHSLARWSVSSRDSSHASKSTMVHKTSISTTDAFQSTVTADINATNAFQSRTTRTENGFVFLTSKTIQVLSSRSHRSHESSPNNRFPSSTQTLRPSSTQTLRPSSTQTPRPSRIINSALSGTGVSETPRLDLKTRMSETLISRSDIYTRSLTIRADFKTSKRFLVTSSSHKEWQFSRHANNSRLAQTVHLSSTTNSGSKSDVNIRKSSKLGNLKTSKSLASSSYREAEFSRYRNNSYPTTTVHFSSIARLNFVSKSHINAFESSTLGSLRISTLHGVALSTYRGSQFSQHGNNNSYLAKTVYLSATATTNKRPISRIQSVITSTKTQNISTNKASIKNVQSISLNSSASLGTQKSYDQIKTSRTSDEIKVTAKTTDSESQDITKEPHVRSSHQSSIITTTRHQASSRAPSMPLYVLAICVPVAVLCGFTIAFVFFKRNQEDHRVRYSVTVEISSEKPDYEMKRMYSVIDVTSGINKDFLSGLESRKASNANVLDQLDGESISATKPDQTV